MSASRRSQPYRRGAAARGPGPALEAMLRGAAATGMRPAGPRASAPKTALQKALERRAKR